MNKYSFDLKDFLIPSVIFAIVLIIAGLITAVYSGSVAFKLIGVSIALLGGIQLFTTSSSRLNDLKAAYAVKNRDNASKKSEDKKQNFEGEKTKYSSYEKDEEEDFRIVGQDKQKKKTEDIDKKTDPPQKSSEAGSEKSEEISNEEKRTPENKLTYEDNDDDPSDMRIVGSIPSHKKKEEINRARKSVDDEPSPVSEALNIENQKEKNITKQNDNSNKNNNQESKQVKRNNLLFKRKHITEDSISELMKDDHGKPNMPKEELDNFLSKLLLVLSSITDTKTAVFALVNEEASEFIIESFVTAVPDKIKKDRNYTISNDLISQVIKNRKPEILKEINPNAELDLLPYYKETTGTSSFVGIPVAFDDVIIGVLCIDSEIEDAYDESLVNLLKDFKDISSALVHNYHEKFNLVHTERILEAIDKFTNIAQGFKDDEDNIIDALINTVSETFGFERTGICGFNEAAKTWNLIAVKDVGGENEKILGKEIDQERSLAGITISEHEPVFQKIGNETGMRLFRNEPEMRSGYFVSVPLRSKTNNYGAFFGESEFIDHMNTYDKLLLNKLAKFAALAIERLNMTELLQTSIMIDHNSGIYNHTAFYHRMSEELQRASDFEYDLSLILIKLDEYKSLSKYGQKVEKIVLNVIHNIEGRLRVYDVFGKADADVFGVLLIEKSKEKAKFWAETVRNEVANSMIEIDGDKVSVTVSVGIAGAEKDQKPSSIFENALKSLHKSLNKTNTVTVY